MKLGKHELRKRTLADIVEMRKRFGNDLSGLHDGDLLNLEAIAICVYMAVVDKSEFEPRTTRDMEGNEIKIGGYKLLMDMLGTDEERLELVTCFNWFMSDDQGKKKS